MAKRWSPSDIAFLKAKAGKESAATIALSLGKSERAVNSFAQKQQISLAVERKRWDEDDDNVIRGALSCKESVYNIAKMLGRSEKAVYHRIESLRRASGGSEKLAHPQELDD